MFAGRKGWSGRCFARKNDIKLRVQQAYEDIKDFDLHYLFEHTLEHPDFIEFAEVPENGYQVDPAVMKRVKQFYIDRGIREQP